MKARVFSDLQRSNYDPKASPVDLRVGFRIYGLGFIRGML